MVYGNESTKQEKWIPFKKKKDLSENSDCFNELR